MKPESKSELKGTVKGALLTLLVIAIFTAGAVYATTIISDTGITIDDNTVLVEGDYSTWTKVWCNSLPDGLNTASELIFFIDETNEVLYLTWGDSSSYARFGLFNLADFSVVFNSSANADYQRDYFRATYTHNYNFGNTYFDSGGVSRSLQTYVLLTRNSLETIEVWRGDSSALWSRNVKNDNNPAGASVYSGLISPSGKWILVYDNWDKKLICYEGS